MNSTAEYVLSLYRAGMHITYLEHLAHHLNNTEKHRFFVIVLELFGYWTMEQAMYEYETFLSDRVRGE